MKIMVVDDETATEPLFKQRFKEEIRVGLFDFIFALSGEDALTKLSDSDNAGAVLILSDINMPGMSGLQLLEELKNQHPGLPVMMVTAYGDESNHQKAMELHADGFINKPIDFAALKDKILKFERKGLTPSAQNKPRPLYHSRILVVDDEPALEALMRQKFRQQIKTGEIEFIFAANGVEALEILDENKDIGIVLTDINMPEMDGLTLLAKLKERKRLFRSIVISAYGDMENIRTAMNLGASDFITKPIDLKDLATTIDKIREQYHCLKQGEERRVGTIETNKEFEIAKHMYNTFSPAKFNPFPENDKVEIFGEVFPSDQICGDFFDFFPIGENKVGFIIADVSGKGVPAALFMVMSKTLMRSTALANTSPAECLKQVSHYLAYNNESMMFVTSFYGILDIDTGTLQYCDAGHFPPYIVSKDGSLKVVPKKGGIALGILDNNEQEDLLYQEAAIQLEKGDTIILFSDGITESVNQNSDHYPLSRLEEVLKNNSIANPSELIQKIKEDVGMFAQGAPQYDDIALLFLRWKG